MKPIAGLNRDNNPIDQPPNTTRYAANGVISEQGGSVQSIRDEKIWENFGNVPIRRFLGWCLGTELIYVWIYNPDDDQGEIWRFDGDDENSKELVIIDPSNILDLDEEAARPNGYSKYLQIVFQQDFEEQEVFAWAGQVKPKIIDVGGIIEDAGWTPGDPPINLDTEGYTFRDFLLFPEGEFENPTIVVNDSGGSVLSGAWFFCYRYVYDDLATTSFSGLSNVGYAVEDSFDKKETFQGDPGNRVTTKSITLTMKYDTTQNDNARIQIGFISIRAGVIYAGILDSKPVERFISGDDIVYTYTGEDPAIDLGDDITELITPKALYKHVETITSLTSRLYAGNLTTEDEVVIQEICNNLTSTWSEINTNPDYRSKGRYLNVETFGAGEVYALYATVRFNDGSESRAFHIPGRKYVAGDDDDIGGGEIEAGTERWQLYDTVTNPNTGYWVNKDEFYPDLPEFASATDPGSPYEFNVRHHKLPSLGYLLENGSSIIDDEIRLNINLTGWDFTGLPQEVQDRIVGVNIYYAKKRIGEFVNFMYDWPTVAGIAPGQGLTLYPIADNMAFSDQDIAIDPADGTLDVIPDDRFLRFHSLWLVNDRPAITPVYFVKEAQYRQSLMARSIVVNSDTYTNLIGDEVTLKNAYKYGAFINFAGTFGGQSVYPEAERYLKIDDFAYVKNGVKLSFAGPSDTASLDNNAGTDSFVIYKEDGFDGPVAGQEVAASPTTTPPLHRFGVLLDTYIKTFGALRAVPSNIATPFDGQTLIFAGSFDVPASTISPINVSGSRGDRYQGAGQFNVTGVCGMGPDSLSGGSPPDYTDDALIVTTTDEAGIFKGEGSKVVNILPAQGPINHVAQYADAGDVQSYVAQIQGSIGVSFSTHDQPYDENTLSFLKTWYFYDQDIYSSHTFYYSDDFNRKNEYFIGGIYDGFDPVVSRFPTTIAFSLQEFADVPNRQWRNWPLLNKYTQPSEKGEIINLKGAGNQVLYIHHRYSLYLTKDRLTLQGNQTNVVLGSGDIFEVTPYEIVSVDEGHTGIANRHWHSLSPFGYSWVQTDHGKIYTHDGKALDEISGYGMRIFFRDNIRDGFDDKDIYCSIINDDLRRRIIVGFNYDSINSDDYRTGFPVPTDPAPSPPFVEDQGYTIAYSTKGKVWSFFQTRNTPHPIVARNKEVFAIVEDSLQTHRAIKIARGAHDNLRRPFIVEVVMNDGTSQHKYLQWVSWNTNVWDTDDENVHYFDNEFETFNKIVVYSDTKIYGVPGPIVPPFIVPTQWDENLFPYIGFPKGTQNVRRTEDNWVFNDMRNLAKIEASDPATPAIDRISIIRTLVDENGPNADAVNTALTWDQKSRMRDKYLIIRLYYEKDNDKQVDLENIDFGVKPSFR